MDIEVKMGRHLALLKKNIKYLRKKANHMSLETLAEEIGMARDSLHKLENDYSRYPNLKTVFKIAFYFGVPIGDLLEKDLELEEIKKLSDLDYKIERG